METRQTSKITITYPEAVKEIEEIFRSELKESETVEFKESISQLDNSLKTICAFLNNKGGSIYFGINDKGKPTGIKLSDANIREISQKIMLKIKPEITPKISDQTINDMPVLKISVEKGINDIYYCNGVVYDRSGTSTVIMPPDEVRSRIIEDCQTQWERQIFKKADLSYLSIPTIDTFLDMARKANRIPEINEEDIETMLKKLGLVTDEGITNAAIVLFGKESSGYFPTTLLRCGRFKDELKKFFIDMKDYGTNIFENLERGIDFLKEHMKIIARVVDLLRVEKWEIPIPALREAIINAMIHRDYSINGFVYIAIYDNRIRISNPGYLMKGLTVDNLYNEHISIHRNELIAKIVYLSGLIDNWGRGTLNIIDYMSKDSLDFPKFEESACYFHIDFKRQFVSNEIENASGDVAKNEGRKVAKNDGNNAAINGKLDPDNVAKNVAKNKEIDVAKNVARKVPRNNGSDVAKNDNRNVARDIDYKKDDSNANKPENAVGNDNLNLNNAAINGKLDSDNVARNVARNFGRNERLEIILNKIINNIRFTKRALSIELNANRKTIERDLEILKKENKIVFTGSKKSGVWKLIE